MAEYEEEYLPLSGIQHFAFCERQWALIHIEKQWLEDKNTFEGRAMHEKADDPFIAESRGTTLVCRSVPLSSTVLKVYGVADVVEFFKAHDPEKGVVIAGHDGIWKPRPVEYKYGQPKQDDRDMVQLCAQAICLEEMLNTSIESGDIFYGRTRHRCCVMFDRDLRIRVEKICEQMYEYYFKGYTPLPEYRNSCNYCSLSDICLPKLRAKPSVVNKYIRAALAELRV